MQKIKLGIVGFGFMGHCDADMMKTFQNIDLVACLLYTSPSPRDA